MPIFPEFAKSRSTNVGSGAKVGIPSEEAWKNYPVVGCLRWLVLDRRTRSSKSRRGLFYSRGQNNFIPGDSDDVGQVLVGRLDARVQGFLM